MSLHTMAPTACLLMSWCLRHTLVGQNFARHVPDVMAMHADVQLSEPGWNALGALGVMAGLAMVVYNDMRGGEVGGQEMLGREGKVGGVPATLSRYRPVPQHESSNSAGVGLAGERFVFQQHGCTRA